MGEAIRGCMGYKGYTIYKIYSKELNVMMYALDAEKIQGEAKDFQYLMSLDRYHRMLKYSNKIDQKLLIGNEILFEYGMKQLQPDCRISEVERAVDKAGKPYIVENDHIYFNMSHAGKYSVCGFSDKPVGVDIEHIQPIDLAIAKYHYREEEYHDIIKQPLHSQLKTFYQYWVLKESFTKAVGLGLSIPLNVFSFQNREGDEVLMVEHKINSHSYLSQQFCFEENLYEMAICVQVA